MTRNMTREEYRRRRRNNTIGLLVSFAGLGLCSAFMLWKMGIALRIFFPDSALFLWPAFIGGLFYGYFVVPEWAQNLFKTGKS